MGLPENGFRVDRPPLWVHGNGMTAADIIDALGGPTVVSAALNLPTTTVGNWKGRNSIPARYHAAVLKLSNGKVTADQIVAAHASVEFAIST